MPNTIRRPGLLLRLGEIFSNYSSGSPDHPGDKFTGGGDEDGDGGNVTVGIQAETGENITTPGGIVIQAENQA